MNFIFDFCRQFTVIGKVLIVVAASMWFTSIANAQECSSVYGNCLGDDDHNASDSVMQGTHNPVHEKMIREMQRQHELGLMQERAHREVDAVMMKNLLRLCAPYNEGCRQELNGQ